jgi:hypothetical protein
MNWKFLLPIRLKPAGLFFFFNSQKKETKKSRPLCSLSLKMRFRFAMPAKLALAFPVYAYYSQVISLSAWLL